jgi:hypothetical protein
MTRLLALLLALPGLALAAEPAGKAATPMAGSDIAGQLGQLLLGLLLVIGLIFVLVAAPCTATGTARRAGDQAAGHATAGAA